jgi:hypothetical protein
MAIRTPHVALLDLLLDGREAHPAHPLRPDGERFDFARPMVKVQDNRIALTAIDTWIIHLEASYELHDLGAGCAPMRNGSSLVRLLVLSVVPARIRPSGLWIRSSRDRLLLCGYFQRDPSRHRRCEAIIHELANGSWSIEKWRMVQESYTRPGRRPLRPHPRVRPRERSSPRSLDAEPLPAWGAPCHYPRLKHSARLIVVVETSPAKTHTKAPQYDFNLWIEDRRAL